MIIIDPRTETPVAKSHNWLTVDTNGVLRYIKDFSHLPNNIVRYSTTSPASQVIFDGSAMITYDRDFQKLVLFDAAGYKELVVAYGNDLAVLNSGNIVLQTSSALICYNRTLTQIWSVSRDARGWLWYDHENDILYSTQGTTIDKIDPSTGTILKTASIPYSDYHPVKVGNYIIAHRRENTGMLLDLDLTILNSSIIPGGIYNNYPIPVIATQDGFIARPNFASKDTRGDFMRFTLDTSNNTYRYSHTIPRNMPEDTNSNWNDIMTYNMQGTKHKDYFAYIRIAALATAQHLYGYAPRTAMWLQYAIHTTEKVIGVFTSNRSVQTLAQNTDGTSSIAEYHIYDLYISSDGQNWEEVPADGRLQNEYTGDVYIRIEYNPEWLLIPILSNIILATTKKTTFQDVREIALEKHITRKE